MLCKDYLIVDLQQIIVEYCDITLNEDFFCLLYFNKTSRERWLKNSITIPRIIDGNTCYYLNSSDILHRNEKDGPAIENSNGTKHCYKKGKRHREDGPAIEFSDGEKQWYKEGKEHREDGPAVEESNGTKRWYKEGERHRENGPAVEYSDGSKEWYKEGVLQ